MTTNQVGNLMYGFYAQMLGLREAAREYGRGSGLTGFATAKMGMANDYPWSSDGTSSSEAAFNGGIGISTAMGVDSMF